MGQITKAIVEMMRKAINTGNPPPLTLWEYTQLAWMAERWIEHTNSNSAPTPLLQQALEALELIVQWDAEGLALTEAHIAKSSAAITAIRAHLEEPKPEPVAWVTQNDEGEPAMLFFDQQEARHYCAEGEEPRALIYGPCTPTVGGEG